MARGGYRPGSGRKKGSLGAAGKARLAIANRPINVTPLEFMLTVMRDATQPKEIRDWMAIAAAPYCHPKARGGSVAVDDQGRHAPAG